MEPGNNYFVLRLKYGDWNFVSRAVTRRIHSSIGKRTGWVLRNEGIASGCRCQFRQQRAVDPDGVNAHPIGGGRNELPVRTEGHIAHTGFVDDERYGLSGFDIPEPGGIGGASDQVFAIGTEFHFGEE